MTLRLPPWAKHALQFLLTAGVTWFILRRIGVTWGEVRASALADTELRAGWLFLSSAVLLLGFLLSARSWGWMVGELGGIDPGGRASARIFLVANLGRYLPGKLWQMAGLAYLGRREGVPAAVGTASGILGQGFALGAAAIVALPALLANRQGGGSGFISLLGILLLLGLLAFLLAVSVPPLFRRIFGFLFRRAGVAEVAAPPGRATFGPRWLALHLLIWAIYGGAFLLFLKGVGLESSVPLLASAFAAAYLLGYLALFAPAGIGVREGVLIALLRPEVGSSAVGIAFLARLWITLMEVAPAGALAIAGAGRPATRGGDES